MSSSHVPGPRLAGPSVSRPSRRRRAGAARATVVLTCVGLVALGCSKAEPGAAPGTTASSTTTAAPTTTTTEATTTTTAPAAPVWPLTGEGAADPAVMNLPVVAVKVDNSPDARPHAGINTADQVYELQVEGITRFMELYHSQAPDRVGPVRSARSSDLDLFGNLNRPLLIWSGGNPGVTQEINDAQANGLVIDVGHPSAAGRLYYRDDSGGRFIPHNLFTNVPQIRAEFTPPDSGPPPAMFRFRKEGDPLPATAEDMPGMVIDFGLGVRVEYVWDAERSGWDRYQVDQSHPRGSSAFVDETGTQISPQNVVILFLEYGQDPVDGRSPKAYSVGNGEGVVLTQGKLVYVNWIRRGPGDEWNITERASGEPVALTPGRTWVALPQSGADSVAPIDAAGAADLGQYRK